MGNDMTESKTMTLDERAQTYATSAPKIQYCPCCGVGIMWKFHDDDFKAGWKECFEWVLEKLEKQYEGSTLIHAKVFAENLKHAHKKEIGE